MKKEYELGPAQPLAIIPGMPKMKQLCQLRPAQQPNEGGKFLGATFFKGPYPWRWSSELQLISKPQQQESLLTTTRCKNGI
jgi:hypothetical protein